MARGRRASTAPGIHRLGTVDERTLDAVYRNAARVCGAVALRGIRSPRARGDGPGVPGHREQRDQPPRGRRDAGTLVPVGDVEAWTDALVTTLPDDALREEMPAAGASAPRASPGSDPPTPTPRPTPRRSTPRNMAPVRVLLDVSAVPAAPGRRRRLHGGARPGLARATHSNSHLVDPARRHRPLVRRSRPGDAARRVSRTPPAPARVGADRRAAARAPASAPTSGTVRTTRCRCGSRIPTVVTVHDLTFFDHPEWHERSKVALLPAHDPGDAAAPAAAIVCVQRATPRDRLRGVLAPRRTVVVAPPRRRPRAASRPTTMPPTARALAAHGIRPPYIAFAGTIEPRKDVPTLVDAFARIAPRPPRPAPRARGRRRMGRRSRCATRDRASGVDHT